MRATNEGRASERERILRIEGDDGHGSHICVDTISRAPKPALGEEMREPGSRVAPAGVG